MSKEAVMYFGVCMVHYSNEPVYGTLNLHNVNIASNAQIKIVERKSYYQDVRVLFDNLTNAMTRDTSGGQFAIGKHTRNYFRTIIWFAPIFIRYQQANMHHMLRNCSSNDSSCTEKLEYAKGGGSIILYTLCNSVWYE